MGPALGEGALEGFDHSIDVTVGKILELDQGAMSNMVARVRYAAAWGSCHGERSVTLKGRGIFVGILTIIMPVAGHLFQFCVLASYSLWLYQ